MTNPLLGSVNRFWLEVNASVWRYCPEFIQLRLTAAYGEFTEQLQEHLRDLRDAEFGRGWREGHEVGRQSSWLEREREWQAELARKNDHIQALMIIVESQQARLQRLEHASADASAELAEQLRDMQVSRRSPVH